MMVASGDAEKLCKNDLELGAAVLEGIPPGQATPTDLHQHRATPPCTSQQQSPNGGTADLDSSPALLSEAVVTVSTVSNFKLKPGSPSRTGRPRPRESPATRSPGSRSEL